MPVDVNALLREIDAAYKKLKGTFVISSDMQEMYFPIMFPSMAKLKSISAANNLRNMGNDVYRKGIFSRALTAYTQSLAASPEGSEEIALAYANRSAVLFELKKYVPCLLDINRALRGNCPNRLEEKLRDRKKRCLTEIRASDDASGITGDETDSVNFVNGDDEEKWRNICKFDHPSLPKTSSKIKLHFNKTYGRHMVATEDIEPAEILSSEEFVSIEVLSGDLKNCCHCAVGCYAPIPCPSCPVMLYCSERCMKQAYGSYHRIECQLWPFHSQVFSSLAFRMAVRTLLIGTEQGAKLETLMNTLSIENIFAENGHPPVNELLDFNYLSTLTLYRDFNESRMKYCLVNAVKTIIWLRHLNFFTNVSSSQDQNSLNEKELFAVALLLNHCDWLEKNHFFFTIMACRPNLRIAGHVFLHSFVNHSCFPNVFGLVRNREHVLVATRPIKMGEQVCMCYSESFDKASKADRAKMLANYYDIPHCRCEACTQNWLTGPYMRKLRWKSGSQRYGDKELLRDMMNLTAPVLNGGILNLEDSEILQVTVNMVKLINNRTKPPSFLFVVSRELFQLVAVRLYDDLDPIKRADAREKSFLDVVEDVVDQQYADFPEHPVLSSHFKEILSITEKFYVNILKRFSEDRSAKGYCLE